MLEIKLTNQAYHGIGSIEAKKIQEILDLAVGGQQKLYIDNRCELIPAHGLAKVEVTARQGSIYLRIDPDTPDEDYVHASLKGSCYFNPAEPEKREYGTPDKEENDEHS